MEDFVTIDEIKALYQKADYINLSTIRSDGRPHPSNVRIVHGHSLSIYFLTEVTAEKSKNIVADSRVGGSILIDKPKAGTGFNLYFDGIAHRVSKEDEFLSLYSVPEEERVGAIKALCHGREDYASNSDDIVAEKGDIKLHRIFLTQAWYNGGIYKEGSRVESNATKTIKIVGDRSCPLVRRYMVDGDLPIPPYAIDLPPDAMVTTLG